jgi:hypothetical protein
MLEKLSAGFSWLEKSQTAGKESEENSANSQSGQAFHF